MYRQGDKQREGRTNHKWIYIDVIKRNGLRCERNLTKCLNRPKNSWDGNPDRKLSSVKPVFVQMTFTVINDLHLFEIEPNRRGQNVISACIYCIDFLCTVTVQRRCIYRCKKASEKRERLGNIYRSKKIGKKQTNQRLRCCFIYKYISLYLLNHIFRYITIFSTNACWCSEQLPKYINNKKALCDNFK